MNKLIHWIVIKNIKEDKYYDDKYLIHFNILNDDEKTDNHDIESATILLDTKIVENSIETIIMEKLNLVYSDESNKNYKRGTIINIHLDSEMIKRIKTTSTYEKYGEDIEKVMQQIIDEALANLDYKE